MESFKANIHMKCKISTVHLILAFVRILFSFAKKIFSTKSEILTPSRAKTLRKSENNPIYRSQPSEEPENKENKKMQIVKRKPRIYLI